MQYMTKEQRAVRDADFKRREQPRQLWSAQDGTAVRAGERYVATTAQPAAKVKRQLTEAQDNAIGRALRRRANRRQRQAGKPHGSR